MNYISRQKQLATLLRRGGFDALLVTHLPNILYLCGFTGTAGVLLFQVSDRGHKATSTPMAAMTSRPMPK